MNIIDLELILTPKECTSITGLSFIEMVDLEKKGMFPKRMRYGDKKQFRGWLESSIDDWIEKHKDYMVPSGYIGNGLFEKECFHFKIGTSNSDISAVCNCIDCAKIRYNERNASKMTSSDDRTEAK